MNLLTEGRNALIARLQTITIANGYRTDAGLNVRSGWLNEVLQSDDLAFPVIVLQKAKGDQPVAGPEAIKAFPGFSVVASTDAGLDDYDDALDDLEVDLLMCLLPPLGERPKWTPAGVVNITIGAPEQFPPGNGERAASVLVPINLHTIIGR